MKQLSHSKPEGVLIVNNKGTIVLSNSSICQLLNYSEKELKGLSLIKLIPKAHFDLSEENSKDQKNLSAITQDGTELIIDISINPFYGGKELFALVFILESSAKTTQPSSTNIQSSVIFLVLDKLVNIRYVNKYCSTLLGCPEDILYGLNWYENFLPSDVKTLWRTGFDEALLKGAIDDYESTVINKQGEHYTILWTTAVIYDSAGEPVGTFNTGFDFGKKQDREDDLNHIEKITQINAQLEQRVQKQTHKLVTALANIETTNTDLHLQIQKRKEIEEKLMKIQRIYDTVVHNFPDGVIGVLNRQMKYVLIDGKELNEIDLPALGLSTKQVGNDPPTVEEEGTLNKIKKAFDGDHVSFEVAANDRFYHISAVPLHDAENQINEILCVLKNVTERNRLERGLVKALEREKELNELKSRFVTMACHEFKTPLATILSSSFLLENYTGEDYEKEKIVHTSRIKRSVNNLTMILNEFLSLEESRVSVINSTLEIPKFIRDLITEIEPAKQKGQSIIYEHTGDEQIFLDYHLLWSIITNLISNALKYSKQGDLIHVKSEIHDNILIISIIDVGIGIPSEEINNILGRFYRAKNSINFDGTGLGLYIVNKNINLLNGNIVIKSELTKGSEFIVTLPGGEASPIITSFALDQKYE